MHRYGLYFIIDKSGAIVGKILNLENRYRTWEDKIRCRPKEDNPGYICT